MKRLQIMLEEDLDDSLARMAREQGTSKAALIRQFIRAAIGELPPLYQDPLFTMAGADDYEPDEAIDDVVYQ